jgi:hypothetical protein
MDSVGFFGWTFVSFDEASGDKAVAVAEFVEGDVSASSLDASLPLPPPSPAELSVLEAMLAALGWDKSLAGPLLMVDSDVSAGSGITGGFFRILPSTGGGFVPSLPLR